MAGQSQELLGTATSWRSSMSIVATCFGCVVPPSFHYTTIVLCLFMFSAMPCPKKRKEVLSILKMHTSLWRSAMLLHLMKNGDDCTSGMVELYEWVNNEDHLNCKGYHSPCTGKICSSYILLLIRSVSRLLPRNAPLCIFTSLSHHSHHLNGHL